MPIQIGEYVVIGSGSVIEAAAIGTNVVIGNNVIIGRRAIIKDCTVVMDNTVIAPDTVVPPFSCFCGIPGKIIEHCESDIIDDVSEERTLFGQPHSTELSPSTPKLIQEYVKKLYNSFKNKEAESY